MKVSASLVVPMLLVLASGAQDFFQHARDGVPAIPVVAQEANTNPMYKSLRNIGLGDTVRVKGWQLKRDAGIFTLDGVLAFFEPVNGRVTGAAFFGQGTFSLDPPIDVERKSLEELTKEKGLHEQFDVAVFRFTDDTFEEAKRAGAAVSQEGLAIGDAREQLGIVERYLRKKLKYNLDGRILEDVAMGKPGGLFYAFIKGKTISDKMVYAIDPHGLSSLGLAPEEVALFTDQPNKAGAWAAFHFSTEYANHEARGSQNNLPIDIEHQKLDTRIDGSGRLDGVAQTTVVSRVDGLRVLPFDLFHTLRVRNVLDADGKPLEFIQENKDEDAEFFVVLSQPLAKGERVTLTTAYSGREAVLSLGKGDYYPVARDNWYPNSNFSDYATYEMTFHAPPNLTMVATGLPGRSYVEGGEHITEWTSAVPQAVAGFNLGNYRMEEAVDEPEKYKIEGYANVDSGAFASVLKREVGEAQLAIRLYTDFFGPAPYQRVAVTEQPVGSYGQSWPALIFLPNGSFHDVYWGAHNNFFRPLAAHEVAHQWFGHAVGISSYRDNWLNEGFAHFAASLYLQYVFAKDPEVYREFLHEWKRELLERNYMGKRPIDVGSVTMGYRLGNTKVGFDVNRLIYPKGGYILHMLRMMMWNPETGDSDFKAMMHDYVHSNYDRLSSTEDFKDVVERHMTREMDQTGDGKMDWFFNQFVYGTSLPDYKLESSFTPIANGFMMNIKITQSNVDEKFTMPVPVYLDFGNKKIIKAGAIRVVGNTSTSASVPLTGISEPPKRVLLNYNYDILSTEDGK
jgi:peptidase M1-like protein